MSGLFLADAEQIVYNVAAATPREQEFCDRSALDCTSEGTCGDCGNDLDTLCPLLALPGMLAVIGASAKGRDVAGDPS